MSDDDDLLAYLAGFLNDCEILDIADLPFDALPDATVESFCMNDNGSQVTASDARHVTMKDNCQDSTSKMTQSLRTPKRKLKYVNKLKSEKLTLQEQEKTLSAQLSDLQQSKKRVKVFRENTAELPVWMAIALRQEQGQREAEEQQQQLQAAVDNRTNVIRNVEESLKLQVEKLTAATGLSSSENVEAHSADIALFEEYVQDMDEIYSKTNEVFGDCGVEEFLLVPYREGPSQKRIGGIQYSEFLDVLPIPFDFDQTCSAMWTSILQSHGKEGRQHYSGVADPENTLAVHFRLSCPRKSGDCVNFVVHFVTRRYVEPDKMVIVWKALTVGEGQFSGMHLDETGWSVVRANTGDGADMIPTIMQTFLCCMPAHVCGESRDQEDLESFANLVLESGDEDGFETARLMESLIIDDSLGKDVVVQ